MKTNKRKIYDIYALRNNLVGTSSRQTIIAETFLQMSNDLPTNVE